MEPLCKSAWQLLKAAMAPDTSNKQRYTAALLEVPGMAFDISISDPKERIQAYIDTFRQPSRTGEKVSNHDSLLRNCD